MQFPPCAKIAAIRINNESLEELNFRAAIC